MIVMPNTEATHSAGMELGGALIPGDIVILSGQLGAGKTTFARGILNGVGYVDDVPSPSFPIVIAYDLPEMRLPIWHVDLYRIDDPDEMANLGLDDAITVGALIAEWPEMLPNNLREDALQISITVQEGGTRHLTAKMPPSWEKRWPF